eukprot:s13_g13.t1
MLPGSTCAHPTTPGVFWLRDKRGHFDNADTDGYQRASFAAPAQAQENVIRQAFHPTSWCGVSLLLVLYNFRSHGYKSRCGLRRCLLTGCARPAYLILCPVAYGWLLRDWSQCQALSKGMWLQDIQSQTCAPLLVRLHSGPCDAYKAAYILGIVSVLTYITNWILMACSCAMLWQYMSGKHKPEYRDWSFYLICAGLFVLLVALLLWSFIALPALDRLGSMVNIGGSPAGASYGYFFMWFSFIFQCAAAFLHWWMPLSNEMTEELC